MYLTNSITESRGGAFDFHELPRLTAAAPQHAKLHEAAPGPSSELGVKKPLLYFHMIAMLLGDKHHVLNTR
jgi:hypothetical protein